MKVHRKRGLCIPQLADSACFLGCGFVSVQVCPSVCPEHRATIPSPHHKGGEAMVSRASYYIILPLFVRIWSAFAPNIGNHKGRNEQCDQFSAFRLSTVHTQRACGFLFTKKTTPSFHRHWTSWYGSASWIALETSIQRDHYHSQDIGSSSQSFQASSPVLLAQTRIFALALFAQRQSPIQRVNIPFVLGVASRPRSTSIQPAPSTVASRPCKRGCNACFQWSRSRKSGRQA